MKAILIYCQMMIFSCVITVYPFKLMKDYRKFDGAGKSVGVCFQRKTYSRHTQLHLDFTAQLTAGMEKVTGMKKPHVMDIPSDSLAKTLSVGREKNAFYTYVPQNVEFEWEEYTPDVILFIKNFRVRDEQEDPTADEQKFAPWRAGSIKVEAQATYLFHNCLPHS